MIRRAVALAFLGAAVAMCVVLAGCSAPSENDAPQEARKSEPVAMPDVVGLAATEALDALDAALGEKVPVDVFSAKQHGPVKIVEPDSRRSEDSTITTQSPAAGVLVRSGQRVKVVAGSVPPGEGVPEWAGYAWFYHPPNVKKFGADPCFDCHQPTQCANCHTRLAGEREGGADWDDAEAGPEASGTSKAEQRSVSALARAAGAVFGTGSRRRLGVRDVLFRSGDEGGYYTVTVTADRFASEKAVRTALDDTAKRFLAAIEKDEEFASLRRIEIAWFRQGAEVPAVVMVCTRTTATWPYEIAVDSDYNDFEQFLGEGR